MMTSARILRFVTDEPFRRFRIKMNGGDTFEIRHPEMIQVGRSTATIFTWMNEGEDGQTEREVEISLSLVESIEPFKTSTPPSQSESTTSS